MKSLSQLLPLAMLALWSTAVRAQDPQEVSITEATESQVGATVKNVDVHADIDASGGDVEMEKAEFYDANNNVVATKTMDGIYGTSTSVVWTWTDIPVAAVKIRIKTSNGWSDGGTKTDITN